ncbi:MAG TPA: dihydrofolate reductase family protein [Pyrinomonadaceae bacterium]
MRKVVVFNSISLDGFFTDLDGDMSWAHKNDPEWNDFTSGNAQGGDRGLFLFGRVTYQMMASWWPSPQALQTMPEVANAMNSRQKVVFSRTLEEATWSNTRLVKDNMIEEVQKLKNQDGENILIFGSGTIVAQLTKEGLIDEYQLVICPIVLGSGRTMFEGVKEKVVLKRTQARTFDNGNVFASYERVF